jgi:hypothetical protein
MHINRSATHHQQRRIRVHAGQTDSYAIFNLLTDDSLLDHVERLSPAYRERLFPPTQTLSMFIAQALSVDRSCQNSVNQAVAKRFLTGLRSCSAHTGGYCRARQRLPQEMISGLCTYLGERISAQAPSGKDWRSRRICLVDGTTMTMPDTPCNQADFPQQRGQAPGLGFPICRWVGITCLASGALLNAAIGRFKGKGASEQSLLRGILDTFEAGDIVLGDALYATWFLLAQLQARKVDSVMEQHGGRRRSTDFRKGKRLGERDHLIALKKPPKPDWLTEEDYAAYPDTLTVREFKAGGKIMVTTLLKHRDYPKDELKQLYKSRWHVEVDIRNIKDTLGMNILSCRTPEMVQKEIWVYLLAYNLIRLVMLHSALWADVSPRQLSFKHSLQLSLAWMMCCGSCDEHSLQQMLQAIATIRVGKRPGRIEPRAVKRRQRVYPVLSEPRSQARSRVAKNGHPKKVK